MPPPGQFFWYRVGHLVLADGSEQAFNGFAGYFEKERLTFTTGPAMAGDLGKLSLDYIRRIDFTDRQGGRIRAVRVQLTNGKMKNIDIVEDYKWAEFESDCFGSEQPIIEGRLSDPNISAVVFRPPS
jgi:hypothetical protein